MNGSPPFGVLLLSSRVYMRVTYVTFIVLAIGVSVKRLSRVALVLDIVLYV
jgi:hypothetical protein